MPDAPDQHDGTAMDRAEHYFTAQPVAPRDRRQITVRLVGQDMRVWTAGGVFSGDRLDLGTSVLLRAAPEPPPTGTFLDLGCGWGPLALSLAMQAPAATVWAVDVNERAVALTRENSMTHGLGRVRAVTPEEVPGDIGFDLIWSNPPIRVGKSALHDLLRDWVSRLNPGGSAYLVVQRHLGADSLHAWLAGTLAPSLTVERCASAKGFRLLRVHRGSGEVLPDPA